MTNNKSIARPLTLTLILGIVASVSVLAQRNVLESDPLMARRLIVYDQVGAYIGPSFNGQSGTIVTDCDCEFTGGAGAAVSAGFLFEKLTRSTLLWGVSLGYENRGLTGRFREVEGVVQTAPSNGQQYTVPITFLNEASVSLHFLSATPYLKYRFFDVLFARAGASVSYVFSSNLTHVKTLESEEVTFPNGEKATVSLPGSPSGSVELQNGAVPDLNALQISGQLGVGAEIKLSKKLFLSPVLQYVQPFTSISSNGEGYSVRACQFLIEMRMIL